MISPGSPQEDAFEPSIGICTALPKELTACRLILDFPSPVNSDSADDGNQYYRASIPSRADGKPHQVLLTSLAKMGNNVAAGAVTHMVRSFPSVDYILMVGIAGGIPDPDNAREHVRLGDVVVSNEKGVLQYDQVKKTPDSSEIRDSSTKPGAALIAATKVLESDFDLGQFSLEPHLRRAAHLAHFQRPAPETDVLYAAEDQEKRIPHPDDPWREANPTSPRIHLGTIGSANILLKHPRSRDKLREEHEIRAIEMEGSGTADAAWSCGRQYLVVRGICDYCDTYKNDDWQYYAALAAAAYARVLIENFAYHPPRRYDPGTATRPEIHSEIDHSVAAQEVDALDIEQLRSELGDVFAEKLESITEKRVRVGPDAAWDELSTLLATMPRNGISNQIQARFFYQAARWSQEDGRPRPRRLGDHATGGFGPRISRRRLVPAS
jgi:nucleoside phosphorylase